MDEDSNRKYVIFGILIPMVFLLGGIAFFGISNIFQWVMPTVGFVFSTSVVIWLLKKNKHLRDVSITDPLTGLLNRRGGERALRREVGGIFRQQFQKNGPEEVKVVVVSMDVDHFKKLNDTLGHAAGDEGIIEIAALIHKAFGRETDVVTRRGGDEIVVFLPQSDAHSALKRVEEVLLPSVRKSERLIDLATKGGIKQLSLSVGIASGSINRDSDSWGSDLDRIIGEADSEMYTAKHSGGDRASVWVPENWSVPPRP